MATLAREGVCSPETGSQPTELVQALGHGH